MSDIRKEIVNAALNRAYALIDTNIHNDIHKHYEFLKQTILSDESLTEDEKTEAIKKINKTYDREKVRRNEGTKRNCENCNQECLATLFCEYCVRNYLKANFPNWTSGNVDIDNLIQKCQLETITPEFIVEWIPYNNLIDIEYLTKGGFSEIYTAGWVGGYYIEWDSKNQQLKRFGNQQVVLKKLENVENANQRWLDEAKSNFTISGKYAEIVPCYGLTQDPSSGNYMLVMHRMDIDLRMYLQQNHNQLTWKERIKIINDITIALFRIHKENAIHRDLHSGNIIYSQIDQEFYMSDLGFCGPADKSSESIYGNLPYIAPEVISGKRTTKASDIYSIGILMWEISSGQPPFVNYERDYYLAINIINGIRPKIVPGTPLEYKNLMKQCWDADPLKRPSVQILWETISEINLRYQNESTESETNNSLELTKTNLETNYTSSRLFTSKVHQFENFPEPRNATEEEQEAFHNNSYKFYISDDDKELDDNEEYISKEHEFDISKEYKFDVNNIQSSSQNIISTIQNSSNTHQNTICTSMPSSKQRKRDIEESEIETQKDVGKRVKILNSEFSD